jgi:protein-L-isoaspartate(D-aspartate) O-methyltransferase
MDNDPYAGARQRMLDEIRAMVQESSTFAPTQISDTVLAVLARIPRHRFVSAEDQAQAYANQPLSIGQGQTISQPFIVALMSELLQLEKDLRVLEVGTGSGYQTAVLAELAGEVFSSEVIPALAARTGKLLDELGYRNIHLQVSDGSLGWPEKAPFDRIIVTAAAEHLPKPLLEQLKPGGRMVIPVGESLFAQDLLLVSKSIDGKLQQRSILPVRFVPLT